MRLIHAFCLLVLLMLAQLLPAQPPPAPATSPAVPTQPAKPVPPADNTGATTKLSVLTPDPALLQAPEGLTGEFKVASQAPKVRFAILPGQWPGAELWSNWGDSLWASDGMIYCSIGDHASVYGHSYIYRINPKTDEVKLVVDVNAVLKLPEGQYSPGKVHGTLKELGDGWLYFATYRGSARATLDTHNYRGDWFLRYHLESGKTESLGILVPYCSIPVMEALPAQKLLYGLGVPGNNHLDKPGSVFFVYDVAAGKLKFSGGPPTKMMRAMMLAPDGRAWYEADGLLQRYDPATNTVVPTTAKVPGSGNLRACSEPDAQGIIYGFTQAGDGFRFNTRTETFAELPSAWVAAPQYTTVLRLTADGRYLFYAPGAHGGSVKYGTPVIRMNTQTGERTVMGFLNATLRSQQNYNLGGTFGIAISPTGDQFFACWNGGMVTQKKPDFGLSSVTLLDLPVVAK